MLPTSRRTFLGAAAPLFLPRRVFGANDRIRVGVIGVGGRANLLIDQLPEGGEIIAAADCFQKRAEDSAAKRKAKWQIFRDYRYILDMKEIDGVIIATHDHGRVLPCIRACQAGKDVYAEKPLTLYVAEGRSLVRAVRKYDRVFQCGSQQRSMAMNQVACAFVRNGGLGKIQFVQGANYTSSKPYSSLPEEPVPGTLDWDVWQGQAPFRPYSSKLQFGWMGWKDYSGGEMTNWGAHGIDQVQMAMGASDTGPVEFWPLQDSTPNALAFRYASGVTVKLELPAGNINGGAIFVGEKGRIEITRNAYTTDPANLIKNPPDKEEVDKWNRAQWQATYHMQEWLDCMKSRKRPSADVEVGHRSISVCHLCNITRDLKRKLTWDPAAEKFTGDAEANALLNRPRRRGYELPAEFV